MKKKMISILSITVLTLSMMSAPLEVSAATSKSKSTKVTSSSTSVNPSDYINKTTVKVLPSSKVDISKRTQEFQGLTQNCTKVAYAYADPSGAKSLAVYIFGYDTSTTTKFLNAKKYIPYVLNKLYFDSNLNKTWYKTLTNNGNGIYIILEKSGALEDNEKFGNTNDGFGIRLVAGTMTDPNNAVEIIFHEMGHCIEDCGSKVNNFNFGVDPRTKINYGTGNFVTLWDKLYDDSIKNNTFYSDSYGWDYPHENFAQTSCRFFKKDFKNKLKVNDPIVYNIMSQIYTQYDL